MKPVDIIHIANKAYPDGQVLLALENGDGSGDSLALFIVREIESVCEAGASDDRQLEFVERAMQTAALELLAVRDAIRKERRDIRSRKQ
jgi:hypothetical protein